MNLRRLLMALLSATAGVCALLAMLWLLRVRIQPEARAQSQKTRLVWQQPEPRFTPELPPPPTPPVRSTPTPPAPVTPPLPATLPFVPDIELSDLATPMPSLTLPKRPPIEVQLSPPKPRPKPRPVEPVLAQTHKFDVLNRSVTWVHKPTPQFPRQAMRLRKEGSVRVWMRFDASGRLENFRIVETIGHFSFEAEVRKVLARSQILPIRIWNRDVPVEGEMTFSFQKP